MMKVTLNELLNKFNIDVNELKREFESRGIDLNKISIYILNYIPLRIRHLFFELKNKGLLVIEARAINGKLILFCTPNSISGRQ